MNLLLQASLIEKRKFALIVVDVQNDFITGSLAVAGGKKVLDSVELFSQGGSLHRCRRCSGDKPADSSVY